MALHEEQWHFNWLVLNYGYACVLEIDRKDENGVNPFFLKKYNSRSVLRQESPNHATV
jgi:hypothetical protein